MPEEPPGEAPPRSRPTPEQVLEAAARLVAVGETFNARLEEAIQAGLRRDRRRRHQIYLIAAGLVIDIILTVVVFGIVQSDHTTAERLSTALALQAELSAEVAQLHVDQVTSCQSRNVANAKAAAALGGFVRTFGTAALGQQAAPYVTKVEQEIAAAFAQRDCSAVYPLPAPVVSPSPTPGPAHA